MKKALGKGLSALIPDTYVKEILDKSRQKIAGILNISEGTSKSQLSKARSYLRELLVKYNYITHE